MAAVVAEEAVELAGTAMAAVATTEEEAVEVRARLMEAVEGVRVEEVMAMAAAVFPR